VAASTSVQRVAIESLIDFESSCAFWLLIGLSPLDYINRIALIALVSKTIKQKNRRYFSFFGREKGAKKRANIQDILAIF
jgi:hypothetical protein